MKWLREPLFHFLLIGASVYLLFALVAEPVPDENDRDLVVTVAEIEWMRTSWQQRWMRPPTAEELDDLIQQHIRETVLYREAVAMGLDQNDQIIRRRMAQKMEFLAKDLVNLTPPTEAIIALSIVFLAAEIIHTHEGRIGLTARWPWLIAFLFGLFHGLGFAGALGEIGVPQTQVPLALAMFNVGVETGQLMFVAAVLALVALGKRLPLTMPDRAWRVVPYGIGSLAAFWTIERVASFLPG